jgi:hypothetical protein
MNLPEPLIASNQRQLFVDNHFIDSLEYVRIHQHAPIPRETCLTLNRPWEGETSWCPVVIKDGDKYRMWYRSQDEQQDTGGFNHTFTAYAESEDGICWQRPNLGLFNFNGSTDNNICVDNPNTKNIAVFVDERPGVPESERYKAAGRWSGGKPARIYGLVSPDGLHWKNAADGPLIVASEDDPNFDSPVSAFWDARQECYVLYARGWFPDGNEPRMRAIRMTTSRDFIHWDAWQYICIDGKTRFDYQLYTNAVHPYARAPYYFAFPKRFIETRTKPEWGHEGLSDVLFFASRDGLNFTQPYADAFMRPGLDQNNWHERSIFIGPRVVSTAPGELSLYSVQNYRTPNVHIRRFTLREDGFVSVRADARTGILTTRPFTFTGAQLEINYSTSIAGSIRIALLNEAGDTLPKFALDDCPHIFGDEIARTIRWENTNAIDIQQPIRLQFELTEADLFSFRFFNPD